LELLSVAFQKRKGKENQVFRPVPFWNDAFPLGT